MYSRIILFCLFALLFSCKKLVEIPAPNDQIADSKVFQTEATANNAIAGIYETLSEKVFYNITPTMITGLSSDELYSYSQNTSYNSFFANTIDPSDANNNSLWTGLYNVVYQANAAIEQLNASQGLSAAAKNIFMGESQFLRAFCYYYLVNFYGAVPLLTTSDVQVTQQASRSSTDSVYLQITKDLLAAQQLLGASNPYSNGEKIRSTQLAADALLARVYLYTGNYAGAEQQSSAVISNGSFTLDSDVNNVFLKNNPEAILQLAKLSTTYVYEASYFIITTTPNLLCDSALLSAFETGDRRLSQWTKGALYNNISYTYPYKYKSLQAGSNEYYTLLRLAEQYLIRAESRARQNHIPDAISDLNQLRNRAGLSSISGTISQDSCLQLILHERQVELFAEGGHRWFDLRRFGLTDRIVGQAKGNWHSGVTYYPIPLTEIQKDPHLTQNDGYQSQPSIN